MFGIKKLKIKEENARAVRAVKMTLLLIIFSVVSSLLIAACGGDVPKRGGESADETPISGSLECISDETLAPLMNDEVKEFERIYNRTEVTNESALTRKAIERLLNDEARFIIINRRLGRDEDSVAAAIKMELGQRVVAHDAVCLTVNPENGVEELSITQVKDILSGEIKDWSQVGGASLPIKLFVTGLNSGQRTYLQDTLKLPQFAKDAYPCSSSAQMRGYMKEFKGAFGYLSMVQARQALDPAKRDTSAFKVLRLRADTSVVRGHYPYQEQVYTGEYPLSYDVRYVYRRDSKIALGFASFLSREGQKIFQYGGLAPAMPQVKVIHFKEDN
ncbi:MAG: substrate-binding domain-containing protein [Rhizobacter sp.]|nr:substrate-binding domain-containing protein [Chlorobiales bacterium]